MTGPTELTLAEAKRALAKKKISAVELAKAHIALDTGALLKLYPHRHGCDGFFAAVLERN